MDTIRMRHPELDDRDPTVVPASSLPHHAAAGWELVDDPGPESDPSPASPKRDAKKKES